MKIEWLLVSFICALLDVAVFQDPLDGCSSHTDCTSCLNAGDPLCGWCASDGLCSRESSCRNATTRWLQGEPADILSSFVVLPNTGEITLLESVRLQATLAIPELFENESFLCHFTEQSGLFNITVPAVETAHRVEYLCNISSEVLPQFDDGVAVLDVTLISETDGVVLPCSTSSALTLYRCSDIGSCSDCLSTGNVCGWCNVLKICSVTPTVCFNESFYLQVGPNEDSADVCPLIHPTSLTNGRYIFPVRIPGSINIIATNLLSPVPQYFYGCAIGQTNIPAVYNNRSSITCNVNTGVTQSGEDDSPATGEVLLGGTISRDLEVLWISQDKFHEIDGEDVRVLLYDCSIIADQCSTCIGANIDTTFQCGWCVDPSSGAGDCQHVSECPTDNDFLTNGQTCPDPDILSIQPTSGPPQGGTLVTITGTNLGVIFPDILGGLIKINNVDCTPVEEGYISGTQIVCRTGSYENDSEGFVSVILPRSPNGLRSTLSSQTFSITSPRVFDVFPNMGPMAGGTTLYVSGAALDIGNVEDTSVSIAVFNNSSVECVVQAFDISSTELVCVTGPYQGPTPQTGQLVVQINNAILNASEVVFTYITNPVVTELTTPTTIPAGGVSLRFLGTNLRTVEQPRFIINDNRVSNGTVVETLCEAESQTVLICPAPMLDIDSSELSEAATLSYTVMMDNAPGPNFSTPGLQLSVRPNPSNLTLLTTQYIAESGEEIIIQGRNLDSVERAEIQVRVADEICMPRGCSVPIQYCCLPPQTPPDGLSIVQVSVGMNLNFVLDDSLRYVQDGPFDAVQRNVVIGSLVAVVVFVVLIVVVVVVSFVVARKFHRKSKKLDNLPSEDKQNSGTHALLKHLNTYAGLPGFPDAAKNEAIVEMLTDIPEELLVPSNQLRLLNSIGQGEFGVVYKAHLTKWHGHGEPRMVAVKTLKGLFATADVESMVGEILRMQHFDHRHVMSLIGVCLDGGSGAAIVMPYMANGSMLDYLKTERTKLEPGDDADVEDILAVRKLLLRMCAQVAQGMEYLALQKFVHRDLAARNCMIDANGDIKVADFGLSENVYTSGYYRQEKNNKVRLPIKWMAPESLEDGVFSEKSDVWSFGVTCWEVFSCGRVPYPGVDPFNIFKLIQNGHRLDKPSNNTCAAEIYSVMRQCWYSDPKERPPFAILAATLDRLLQTVAGYMELSMVLTEGTDKKEH